MKPSMKDKIGEEIEQILNEYNYWTTNDFRSEYVKRIISFISLLLKEERERVIEEVEEKLKSYDYYCECEDSCGCAYEITSGISEDIEELKSKLSKKRKV